MRIVCLTLAAVLGITKIDPVRAAPAKASAPSKSATTAAKKQASGKASKTPVAKAPAKPITQAALKPRQLSPEEIAKKKEILESPYFRELQSVFNQWLAVQKTYKKDEIPKLKAEFRKKVDAMTPGELEQFLSDMQAKLMVLMSPQAQEARDWLGYFVSAKAVMPADQVEQFDIVHMSAEELQQALERVEAKRNSLGQASRAFHSSRQARIASDRVERQQAAASREAQRQASQQRSTGSYYPPAQSAYAPRKSHSQGLQSRMSYYLSPWGGVGIVISP